MTTARDALTTPFSLSTLTVTKGNATKHFMRALDLDEKPARDHSKKLGIRAGQIRHTEVTGLANLATALPRFSPQQCLIHGIPTGSTPGDVFTLVVAEQFTGTSGTIARTKECFAYPPGVRVLMFDRDPEPEAEPMDQAEALMLAMAAVVPSFADVGWLATSSTSSALRRKADNAWLRPPDGWHLYFLATGEVDRFQDLLKVRLWLAGHGFCKLATQNPQTGVCAILERALVDLTVFSPERLDYVAGAIIPKGAPFYQDRPLPTLHAGGVVDLDTLPDVTEPERQEYAALVAEAKERLEPERRARVWAVVQAARPPGPDVSPVETEAATDRDVAARLDQAARGMLAPDHLLYFANGTTVTAEALCAPSAKKLDGKRLADPQEPSYREGEDAVFHWRKGQWRIVSWAHGVQTTYQLAPTYPDAPVPDPDEPWPDLDTVGDADDIDGLARLAQQDDDERPPAVRYRATRAGLLWMKPTKDGSSPVLLTNFTATITAEITEDDGLETRKRFALAAQLKAHTFTIDIPAAQFAGMSWVTEHLGATAIVMPGMTLKDHARAAIQLLSLTVDRRMLYTHLGWRQIADGWCYLHAGGAIGAHGPVAGVEVNARHTLAAYNLSAKPQAENPQETLQSAVRASLAVLNTAPDVVTIPLYAAIWRAVLGTADFSLHLVGPTGTGKSELAALVQQHFGAGMTARHLPAAWTSTGNALEGLAFEAKDVLLVVDDFCPSGSQADIARFHRDADRLLRAQGNRSGRQRMRVDGTLRPVKPPRGLIVSTGEDTPAGQSLRARVLILDVPEGALQWNKVTPCQQGAAKGVYVQALAGFVQWLAPQYAAVSHGLSAESVALRQAALTSGHRRTPDIIGNLALGMQYFLAYAHDIDALTLEECALLWDRTWTALGTTGASQWEHHASEEPVGRFLALLAGALAAGLAHVADAHTLDQPSTQPATWGWRGQEYRTRAGDVEQSWHPQGVCIGWLANDRLYLEPEAAFSVAQKFGESQKAPLPITQQTLWKRMHEHGLLLRESGRGNNRTRETIGAERRYVVNTAASILTETGPIGPIGPIGQEPQQNQGVFVGQFPVWYTQKLAHSAEAKLAHSADSDLPPSWASFTSHSGPVSKQKWPTQKGQEPQQNQAAGPIGPIGPVSTAYNTRSFTDDTLTLNGSAPCPIAVGDLCFLFAADGAPQNRDPYLCTAIEPGPDGQAYARFLEVPGGWLVAHCEKVPDAVSTASPGREEFDV